MMTLGDIVDQYIISSGRDTRHNYSRFYQLGIRALKNLSYDVSGAPTFMVLELDEQNTACVPDNLVKIREIFIPTRGGRLPINENNNKNPQTVNQQGVVSNAVSQIDETGFGDLEFFSPENISRYYRNGQFTGGVFSGNPNGNPYSYIRNYDTNRLEFSSNVCGTVILEYLGSLDKNGNDFCVHPFLEEPVMFYLEWQDNAHKRSVGSGEKARLRKQYHDAKRWAKMQFNSTSTQQIREQQRRGYSLTPS